MNKFVVVGVGVLTSAIVASPALAAPPSWCKGITSDHYSIQFITSDDPRHAIGTIAQATCTPTADATARRAEVDAARAAWSKKLDMVEADWADAVGYANEPWHARGNDVYVNTRGQEIGIGHSLKLAWSSYDAIDQWAMIIKGVGGQGDFTLDDNYLVDALGPNLTEVGRAAYVDVCIQSKTPVQWAMCQGDIAQLDFGKLASEIRANKMYGGADKMRIRVAVAELRGKLTAHAAKVKALVAKDPAYGKLFEIADATRKEWVGRYKSDADLIQLAATMDDARATNSRKAFAGCEETTWKAWKAAAAQVPAKKYDGMRNDRMNGKSFLTDAMGPLLGDPRIYLASIALVTCATVGQDRDAHVDVLVRTLGGNMTRWPGSRGPRTATESAIMGAGIELDDRDAKLEFPSVERPFYTGTGSTFGGAEGVVKALKPEAGNKVTVQFTKKLVKQRQCAASKSTNRIVQILPNGQLVYDSYCTRYETVSFMSGPDPQTVNARYVEGVKPGMFLSITEDVAVSARKPGASTPTMVFGVPVK